MRCGLRRGNVLPPEGKRSTTPQVGTWEVASLYKAWTHGGMRLAEALQNVEQQTTQRKRGTFRTVAASSTRIQSRQGDTAMATMKEKTKRKLRA